MTNRDYAVELITNVVNKFGEDALANDEKAKLHYRKSTLLSPNAALGEGDDDLVIGEIIMSEFRNGIKQNAIKISDLNWKSFSSCDDNYLINIAYRLCKRYKMTDEILALCEKCGMGFLEN